MTNNTNQHNIAHKKMASFTKRHYCIGTKKHLLIILFFIGVIAFGLFVVGCAKKFCIHEDWMGFIFALPFTLGFGVFIYLLEKLHNTSKSSKNLQNFQFNADLPHLDMMKGGQRTSENQSNPRSTNNQFDDCRFPPM